MGSGAETQESWLGGLRERFELPRGVRGEAPEASEFGAFGRAENRSPADFSRRNFD